MKTPDKKAFALLHTYHSLRGGREIRHCGVVKLLDGGELHLCRFVDSAGNRFSSLDMIVHGEKEDHVVGKMVCARHNEMGMMFDAIKEYGA